MTLAQLATSAPVSSLKDVCIVTSSTDMVSPTVVMVVMEVVSSDMTDASERVTWGYNIFDVLVHPIRCHLCLCNAKRERGDLDRGKTCLNYADELLDQDEEVCLAHLCPRRPRCAIYGTRDQCGHLHHRL